MADESWMVPTPVQELAAGVKEPPSRYVLREQDRPGSLLLAADMPEPLPVVDLSRLSAADEAAKLRLALQTWGLFMATNHGIEASLMDDAMNVSREFFRQPLEEKLKCSNLIEGKHFQLEGYGDDPMIFHDQTLDWHDRLHLRLEPEDDKSLAHWPKHPESFRILELDGDYFISYIGDNAPAHARLNYYPPCPRPELVFGIKPHSDAGALTVLLVDKDVGGLQVQRDGLWYNVPSMRHTLLINLGDTMEIMSNGIFKSPVHRVMTNAEKERISLAIFFAVDDEKMIEPVAGLLDEKQPARYMRIKAKDFVNGLKEHFSKGKRIVETLKI